MFLKRSLRTMLWVDLPVIGLGSSKIQPQGVCHAPSDEGKHV